MKRVFCLCLSFAAMLSLIVRASDCAAQGDAMGYAFAGLCGVIVVFLAVGATFVSVQWEMELDREHPNRMLTRERWEH